MTFFSLKGFTLILLLSFSFNCYSESSDNSLHHNSAKTLSSPKSEELTPEELSKKTNNVKVSVYILNLGRYDPKQGFFTVDFYLDMHFEKGVDPSAFEFVNGRALKSELILETPNERFYRIKANLYNYPDLTDFPFDKQKLKIILEDKRNPIEKINYIPLIEETDLDKAVVFTGWRIDGWKATTKIHEYKVWKESYSQYIFEIDISRIFINAFMKTFLPVFFIIMVVLATFVLNTKAAVQRMTICGSGLVGVVMFYLSMMKAIPPIGYLTFADKFMLITFLLMLFSFMLNAFIIALKRIKEGDIDSLQNKADRIGTRFILIVFPLAYIILFLFGLKQS